MATDQLILGSLIFDDWSTPSKAPFGGKQAMALHKLPGGARVADTLGPDEMDIPFSGMLWGDSAYATAMALHEMRAGGQVQALAFAGLFYQVIVAESHVEWVRYPNYGNYNFTCVIVGNPMAGGLGAVVSTFADLVSADMSTAMNLAGF